MAAASRESHRFGKGSAAVGQQRLLEQAERGEVLDTCLYTAPSKYGGSWAGATWLVGSYDEVADALLRYRRLGVTHFVLSDTPYKEETVRVGDQLLPRLRDALAGA
jgi:alkanesulfonate monooxygenase